MPAIGMAMTEGLLVGWLKQPGEAVVAGEAVAEIETDKTTMELESPADGILGPQLFPAGAIVAVGTALAQILDNADEPPSAGAAAAVSPQSSVPAPTEMATAVAPTPEVRERHELSPRARRRAREDARRRAGRGEPFAVHQLRRLVDRAEAEDGHHAEHRRQADGDVEHDPALQAEPAERTRAHRGRAHRLGTLLIMSSYGPFRRDAGRRPVARQ